MLLKKKSIRISDPSSSISEQFREIRTNLYFSSEQKYRTLLISSPGYKEGKSTTAIHLAISIAQQSERVLLVDADVRRPAIQSVFEVENDRGLVNILNSEITFEEAVKSTQVNHLFVLAAGALSTENLNEPLRSKQLRQLIKQAKEQFDLILFDSPPILEEADSRILAHECDGVVLVLNHGKTKEGKVLETKRLLDIAKANLVGVILNHIR